MKQRIIMAIVALQSIIAAFAGNITAEDLTMKPGETEEINLSFSGSVSGIYGIQFEIRLPEGFSLETGSNGKVYEMSDNQADDITCNIQDLGNGAYRFLVYSATLQELRGGNLMSLNLKVSDDVALDNYDVTIENVALSDFNGQVTKEDGIAIGVKVTDFFTLSYQVDGEEYKSYEVEYGATVTPVAEPTKEGYTFLGWNEIPETMPAHNVTVTGSFTINKYQLIYIVDGEEYKSYEVEYGATITKEDEPLKEGYTFSGWSEIPPTMPARNVIVTGSFTVNTYTLTYMVDGTVYKSYEVEYGSAITPEAEPTKEGYTFSGWSDIPETMPAKDVTVNGTFSKGSYKLTYMVDGNTYKTVSYDYGVTITPEAAPTKEGYSFSGWSGVPATMPANDVTVTGTFSINKYKLTYMVDGEVYKTYEIMYGSTLIPEAEPAKDGYTFSGWSEIPETMPAKDVTVTGTFSVNKYKLNYMVDGEVYKSFEIEYGSQITPEAEPVKEGYTFSGWSWIPKKMPNEDVTVSGYFTVNKYKLTYMIGDETYKEVEIEYGSTIPTEPQPEGDYVRFEWVGVPETMPAHDVIVYADFETGILDVMALHGIKCIYSPNGKRISKLQKGVSIVVMNDGSVKKVYVK